MYCTNIATRYTTGINRTQWNEKTALEPRDSERGDILAAALHLMETGRIRHADKLLTAATLDDPLDPKLWLAAGICRLRRGAVRSAEAAFEMSAWLDDDADARDLIDECQQLPFF